MFSGKFGTNWDLLLNTRVAEKIFPPKNFPLQLPGGTVVVATRCLCCCLQIWNPVDSNCWISGCLAVVLSTRLCWENYFNFGTSWWIMRSRNFNRKFLNQSSCRQSVSNYCWTLGCWVVVLTTRPRSSCWQNNFGTSCYSMRSRNQQKIFEVLAFKNYTKFFGGILELAICTPLHSIW